MSVYSDYYRKNNVFSNEAISRARVKAIKSGQDIALYDPEVDLKWAKTSDGKGINLPYFDYYFSGQDIKVSMSELEAHDKNFSDLPIMDLAFQVQQEKTPIYGFWSYTYDAMMRGVRIVNGAFTIATRYPNYMQDLLSKAAESRAQYANVLGDNYGRELTEDDKNIDKYWSKNIDTSLQGTGQNIFSVHPPFNFTVRYGVQQVSSDGLNAIAALAESVRMKTSEEVVDTNHRLLYEETTNISYKLYIEAIELTGVQRQFDSQSPVCVETYSFIARDIITPKPI